MRFGALFFGGDSFLTIFSISSMVIGQHDGQNSEMAPQIPTPWYTSPYINSAF